MHNWVADNRAGAIYLDAQTQNCTVGGATRGCTSLRLNLPPVLVLALPLVKRNGQPVFLKKPDYIFLMRADFEHLACITF